MNNRCKPILGLVANIDETEIVLSVLKCAAFQIAAVS